jgi:hypothetical protein
MSARWIFWRRVMLVAGFCLWVLLGMGCYSGGVAWLPDSSGFLYLETQPSRLVLNHLMSMSISVRA